MNTKHKTPEERKKAKREARTHGLTDEEIDAELDEWRAERRA